MKIICHALYGKGTLSHLQYCCGEQSFCSVLSVHPLTIVGMLQIAVGGQLFVAFDVTSQNTVVLFNGLPSSDPLKLE